MRLSSRSCRRCSYVEAAPASIAHHHRCRCRQPLVICRFPSARRQRHAHLSMTLIAAAQGDAAEEQRRVDGGLTACSKTRFLQRNRPVCAPTIKICRTPSDGPTSKLHRSWRLSFRHQAVNRRSTQAGSTQHRRQPQEFNATDFRIIRVEFDLAHRVLRREVHSTLDALSAYRRDETSPKFIVVTACGATRGPAGYRRKDQSRALTLQRRNTRGTGTRLARASSENKEVSRC